MLCRSASRGVGVGGRSQENGDRTSQVFELALNVGHLGQQEAGGGAAGDRGAGGPWGATGSWGAIRWGPTSG